MNMIFGLKAALAVAGLGIAALASPAMAGQEQAGPESQRGIEKKDIRRGMVIARPGSINSGARNQDSAPGAATPAPEAQEGKGIKKSITNTSSLPY